MPLAAVTAVIPTRNRSEMLRRTLGSVLAQREVDLHVVVVDEASSDDTPALLDRLCATDHRVRVVRHEQPRRLPGARNAGLEHVTTEWTAFCDDDDLWAADKLRAQVDAAEAAGARWCAAGAVNIDIDDRITGHLRPVGGQVADRLRAGNIIPGGGSGVLAATDLVRAVGGFDESLAAAEDYDMWVRLADRSPLAAVDRPLVGYRVWPGTMSTDVVRQRSNHELVAERHGRGDVPREVEREADLKFRQYLARNRVRAGHRWAACVDYLDIALRHRKPTHVVHAGGALVVPQVLERHRARRELAEVPESYRAEAERWLRDLRAVEVA